jgi:thioester reductase-like protein
MNPPHQQVSNFRRSMPRSAEAIEDYLIEQLAKQLKVRPDDIDTREPFNHFGLESRQALVLLAELERFMGIILAPTLIWSYPTIAALTEYLSVTQNMPPVPSKRPMKDLQAEISLDPTIDPTGLPNAVIFNSPQTAPCAIFLTGATGFLGAFLLQQLLHQSRAAIYCLVRAANVAEGRRRLQQNLASYGLWEDYWDTRIIVVVGNLSQPLLGLARAEFEWLAGQIDVIYHCAALVNFSFSYESLRPTNVLGTQEVLRLATQVKVKPVHYVSTMGVFLSVDFPDMQKIQETSDLNGSERHAVGYLQSKWIAEQQVAIAQSRGLPVSIYRPTWISGHSQTGVCNTEDFVCTLIKGCLQLGSAPYLDMTLDMVPVDYVSQAIVHLSQQNTSLGQAFHLCHPHPLPWNQLVDWMAQAGYALKRLTYQQWLTELIHQVNSAPDNVFYPLLPVLREPVVGTPHTLPDIYLQNPWPLIDAQNAWEGLKEAAIHCPPIDATLLDVYFCHLIKSKYLPYPVVKDERRDANEYYIYSASHDEDVRHGC